MSSRNYQTVLAAAFVIFCMVTLLFLIQRTRDELENTREAYNKIRTKYNSLTQEFDSIFEYKQRLEKSYLSLKEEKSSLAVSAKSYQAEFLQSKSNHEKEIARLQNELDTCQRRLEVSVVQQTHDQESPAKHLPLQFELTQNDKQTSGGDGMNINSIFKDKMAAFVQLSSSSASPPAVPSGDPNIDPAGNIFV